MYSNLQNSFSSVSYSDYLSRCDLINKYNLTSTYHIPELKDINLELSLKDFLEVYELAGKDSSDPVIQTKAFIALFNLTGTKPYIKANKSVSSLGRQKTTVVDYSIKVSLIKTSSKFNFLFMLFVENWHRLKLEDFTIFNKTPNKKISDKKFVLNSLIPSNCLFEADEILSKNLTGINSKNLKFRLNLSFENSLLLKNRNNIILNLPFFWISGRVV